MIIGFLISLLLLLGFMFSLIGIFKRWSAAQRRDSYHLPTAEITYTDLDKPAKPLYSDQHSLVGKPDYIVRQDDRLIPIEVKSTHANAPYVGHVFQLAAYCLLVEENYGQSVPYGILQYAGGQQYKIEFTDQLKAELMQVMQEMRDKLQKKQIVRNHESPARCTGCSVRYACEHKLA